MKSEKKKPQCQKEFFGEKNCRKKVTLMRT